MKYQYSLELQQSVFCRPGGFTPCKGKKWFWNDRWSVHISDLLSIFWCYIHS